MTGLDSEVDPLSRRAEFGLLALVLLASFVLRAVGPGQPIVENYVGRQVPTAMVARNLERGSGFGYPQLDTGPFPNHFLVEPPLFAAAAVGLRRFSGLELSSCGRLVSALGMALGVWGLYGLARRRAGARAALLAAAVLAVLPVTIRYGRAFQGDALVLGCLLAALDCWDRAEASGHRAWLVPAWILLACALALKVLAAYALLPLCVAILRPPRLGKAALAASAILPAALWYGHVAEVLAAAEGSRASLENRAIWLAALVPTAWLEAETWNHAGRFLLWRAFTPIGLVLGLAGLLHGPKPARRLWSTWLASAGLLLVLLAAKLHHEYYWLMLAPPLAAGAGGLLAGLAHRGARGRNATAGCAVLLLGCAAALSASTWRTPPEWATLPEVAGSIARMVEPGALVVAPEAVLYAADRRGCRLEFGARGAARAASEWGAPGLAVRDPLELVAFYRARGAAFLADVGEAAGPPERATLHAALRRRYAVRVDRPGVFLVDLRAAASTSPTSESSHAATRRR